MHSRHVNPSLSVNDLLDQPLTDVKQLCQLGETHNSGAIHGPDFNHLSLSKLVLSVKLTLRVIHSSSLNHVAHVTSVSPCVKMARVTARSIVAVVTALVPIWNRTIGKFVSESVRKNLTASRRPRALMRGIGAEHSVSLVIFSPKPWPAFIGRTFLNLSPESYLGCGFSYHMGMEPNH
jgi:hypothetical protein